MKVINQVINSGLDSAKLALATATESDVVIGKTFYSGGNSSMDIKTGTRVSYEYDEIIPMEKLELCGKPVKDIESVVSNVLSERNTDIYTTNYDMVTILNNVSSNSQFIHLKDKG